MDYIWIVCLLPCNSEHFDGGHSSKSPELDHIHISQVDVRTKGCADLFVSLVGVNNVVD